MFRLEIIFFVGVVLVSVCTASMFFSHLPVHEETYVRHVNGRLRRDAEKSDVSPFLEYRTFILMLDGKKVRLDLKLNKHQSDHVRVNLLNNGEFKQFDDSTPRDYAFYQQIKPESRAAVMVRCNNRKVTSCHIVGNIQIGEDTYKIEPKTQEAKLVSKVKHVVYKTNTNKQKDVDYNGDTKTFIIDDSELESHTKIKREIRPNVDTGAMLNELNLMQGTRPKRQTGKLNHKVELALVIDYSVYEIWLKREGYVVSAAIDKIKQYNELMVNDMDARYVTATTSDMTIDVILLEIEIIQDSLGAPWIIDSIITNDWVDASEALDKFQQWAEATTGLSNYDAIMAITR